MDDLIFDPWGAHAEEPSRPEDRPPSAAPAPRPAPRWRSRPDAPPALPGVPPALVEPVPVRSVAPVEPVAAVEPETPLGSVAPAGPVAAPADPTTTLGPRATRPTAERARPRAPRARLSGTAGFLRSMAVPRLGEAAHKLQLARHHALVADELDESPPRIRLTMRPWHAPLDTLPGVASATLELSVDPADDDVVVVRRAIEAAEPRVVRGRIPAATLSAARLESIIVEFVAGALEYL